MFGTKRNNKVIPKQLQGSYDPNVPPTKSANRSEKVFYLCVLDSCFNTIMTKFAQ